MVRSPKFFSSAGWFRILSGDGKPQSLIVPLTSIEQVVASKSNRFLVHSCVTGLWPNQSPSMTTTSKRDSFLDVQIPPGEVLNCGPIFVEPQEKFLKTLRGCPCPPFRKKTDTPQSEKMYLQCRGLTTGMDVLLPLETYGQFSCIGRSQSNCDEGPTTTSQPSFVYQMKDLVNRKDFPQAVHLVYGTPPPNETQSKPSFTGLMALGQTYSEQSIIACQITREDRLAFVEFPDDSEVEFLLANNWEGDASALKAIDFCQQYSDAYELEIQPVIEGIRPHEIADILCRDSADIIRSGTFCKRSFDKRIQPESFDSESATDPTSRQSTTPRLQSGVAVPTIPQRGTKIPTGFHRRQRTSHTPQSTTAIPAALRPRVAKNSSEWCQDTISVDNTPRSDIFVQDNTIVTNSTQRAQDAAVPFQNSSENERRRFAINQLPARFTKSLERHQLNNKAIALVHTPRPSKDLPRSKSEHDHMQNITRNSSGRMTDRKLPPLPSQIDAEEIKNVEELNHGFQESSSEVESNSSDPEKLYERIHCPKEISNEPSPSAPSSPAPTIRHRQETPIAVSPFAYDPDGYLTPVELRDTGSVLEKGRERISFSDSFGSTGNCKKKLGQNLYSSHRRYIMDRIPFNRKCDSERLQSFLDDSVAELYRKQLHRKNSEKDTDNSRERLYQRNVSSDNTGRKRQRSLSTPDFPNQDFPRDEIDVNLETIPDCEDVEIDKEDDYSSRFLRRISSTSLQMRRLNPAAIASYHGYDSAAFSDSGIASRQSTMRNENRERAYWKAIDVLWIPPEDLSSLSVEEVAMSLRYIGMKDQIAVSFSKEQVDGKLLCEMNSHLLKEGFPNMNSLERKKVLDFVQGWRPKRLLFI